MNNRELAKFRYAFILYKLLVWKFLTPKHISLLLDIPLPNAYRYIRRLKEFGLVRSKRVMGFTLISLTANGREFVVELLPEVGKFDIYPAYSYKGDGPHNLLHELSVRGTCSMLYKEVNWVTISYSVWAKVLGRVYGKSTIKIHRADAVRLHMQNNKIFPLAIEIERTAKSKAKMREKLISLANSIGQAYSGVEFFFARREYKQRYASVAPPIIQEGSNLVIENFKLYKLEIYEDVKEYLEHLYKFGRFEPEEIEINHKASKLLSRKLR